MRKILTQEALLALESFTDVGHMPSGDVADMADQAQLSKSSSELDVDIVAIDDAYDVAVALEAIAEALPGADQHGARLAYVASGQLLARVGLALEDGEDFPPADPLGLKKSAQWIGEKAKKIWQAIIAALKRAWAWLKSHVRRLLDMSGRTKKRAEELLAKLKGVQGQPKKDKFLAPLLARGLCIKGKFDDIGKAATDTAATLGTFLDRAFSTHLYDRVRMEEFLSARPNQGAPQDKFHYRHVAEAGMHHMATHLIRVGGGKRERPGGFSDWCTSALLGDVAIARLHPDRDLDGWEALRAMLLGIPEVVELAASKPSSEMPVATPPQMTQCATAALSLATQVNDFRSELEKFEKMADELVKAATGKLQLSSKDAVPSGMFELQIEWQRKYLAAAPRWLVQAPSQIANFALVKAQQLLSYTEKSLSQYEVAKA